MLNAIVGPYWTYRRKKNRGTDNSFAEQCRRGGKISSDLFV
jgi:hypothetical protein